MFKHGIELVAFELVWAEDADLRRVVLKNGVQELSGSLHAALGAATIHSKRAPVDRLQVSLGGVCEGYLAEQLCVVLRQRSEDILAWIAVHNDVVEVV